MTYSTPDALRMALEQRLLTQSEDSGVGLDRLRRRVVFERVTSRIQRHEPGAWVLKGGMALEVRLGEAARLTKDADFGVRTENLDGETLELRLLEALKLDPDGDKFVLTAGRATRLMEDGGGQPTWRVKVAAGLAGRPFGAIQLDVSPRASELTHTDMIQLPNSLGFAEIKTPLVEVIGVNRHAAEKLHAICADYGHRENTRVRDLVDLVILQEHGLLDSGELASELIAVWLERDGGPPPARLPDLPAGWVHRYESQAAELDVSAKTLPEAIEIAVGVWDEVNAGKDAG